MGEIIVFILVGLVVGVLARLLLPGRDPIGIIGTILVGIVGAVLGGYLFSMLFDAGEGSGLGSWIAAILTAMLLLFVYRKMTYGRDRTHTTV